MKKYYPLFLTKYLTKEFIKCLLIIFAVFLSISLLINFVEEIVYFKEKTRCKTNLTRIFVQFVEKTRKEWKTTT